MENCSNVIGEEQEMSSDDSTEWFPPQKIVDRVYVDEEFSDFLLAEESFSPTFNSQFTNLEESVKTECTHNEPNQVVEFQSARSLFLESKVSLNESLNSTSDEDEPYCGVNRLLYNSLVQKDVERIFNSSNCSEENLTPQIYSLDLDRSGSLDAKSDSLNLDWISLESINPASKEKVHYGMPSRVWKVVSEVKGICSLYDWQEECLRKAIANDRNFLYSLPTSAGKSLIADLLMIREILKNQKNCLYAVPFVSIAAEKFGSLSMLALHFNFSVEEYSGVKGVFPPRRQNIVPVVYVATFEKAHGIVNCLLEAGRLREIGLVVVDEIHMIGDDSRGAMLEILLSKLLLASTSPRIVGMSATINNFKDLGHFLKAEIYTNDFRPVVFNEYIKVANDIIKVFRNSDENDGSWLMPVRSLNPSLEKNSKTDLDGIGLLVTEVIPEHSCIVFCPTKQNCENVSKCIADSISGESRLLQTKWQEKNQLVHALKKESGKLCPILSFTIPLGIAYHHSGLPTEERQLIEEAFSLGTLCCLCCTTTLSVGVNLPARRVILRSEKIGQSRMTRTQYQQMIGRAGRAGLDTCGESFLIVQPDQLEQVKRHILLAPFNYVKSQLLSCGYNGLYQLVLSLICYHLGGCDFDSFTETISKSTLLGCQASYQESDGFFLSNIVLESLNYLQSKLLIVRNEKPKEWFMKTALGQATLKASIELGLSEKLYNDLMISQNSLLLETKLHVLFLITPYDLSERMGNSIRFDNHYCFQGLMLLTPGEIRVAHSIGITESLISLLVKNQKDSMNSHQINVLERFYYTLIINEVVKGKCFWDISKRYGCSRGDIQLLLSYVISFAYNVLNFVKELGEFSCFSYLLEPFTRELATCQIPELIPLMKLSTISKSRAIMLFNSGFKTLPMIAQADPEQLMSVMHLPQKIAKRIIASANVYLMELQTY